MSFSLSAYLFYGFELEETGDDNPKREEANDGEFYFWPGDNANLPCATINVGWHDTVQCIGIRSTICKADGYRDNAMIAITIPPLDPAWNEQLREWCNTYGFKYGEPSWRVAAVYQ